MFGRNWLEDLAYELDQWDKILERGEQLTDYQIRKFVDMKKYIDTQRGVGGILGYMGRRADTIQVKINETKIIPV